MEPLFHLSIPVDDLERAKHFYIDTLGCAIGREKRGRFDINFFGHHIVAHHSPREAKKENGTIDSDGDIAALRHFGVILEWNDWQALAKRLQDAGTAFIIDPYIRFKGEPGEQATMFFLDPSGNALEFKSFKDDSQVFAV